MENKLSVHDREWVPTCFLLPTAPSIETKIVFSPFQYQANEEVRYQARFTIFDPDTAKPSHHFKSDLIGLRDVYTNSSRDLNLQCRHSYLYGEAIGYSPETPPPDANIAIGMSLHYISRDATFQGHVGSNPIYGQPRKAYKGNFYYDHFPFGRADAGLGVKIFLLNPYVRAATYEVLFYAKKGVIYESEPQHIGAKSAQEFKIDFEAARVAGESIAAVVRSEVKMNVLYALYSARTGVMFGIDHGHPFLDILLNH